MTVTKKFLWILPVFFLLFSCGCRHENHKVAQNLLIMDTVATLTAYGDNADTAIAAASRRLQEISALVDANDKNSDVSRLNAAAGREAVKLNGEVYRMLEVSQEYSRLTHGAWDATVMPLSELWRQNFTKQRIPSPSEIAAAQKLVGWEKLILNEVTQSAYLSEPGMAVDLGGLVKGYALDEVRRIFDEYGVKSVLINLGSSSICAIGRNNGKEWRVGIRNPRPKSAENTDDVLTAVSLSDASLSTSGDYERGAEIDGIRYHHIIDPRTGYPVDNGVASVTAIIKDRRKAAGMLTDICSTAAFVLGAEEGADFLKSQNIEGIIIDPHLTISTVGN